MLEANITSTTLKMSTYDRLSWLSNYLHIHSKALKAIIKKTRLRRLNANISPDKPSVMPQVLIDIFSCVLLFLIIINNLFFIIFGQSPCNCKIYLFFKIIKWFSVLSEIVAQSFCWACKPLIY